MLYNHIKSLVLEKKPKQLTYWAVVSTEIMVHILHIDVNS